MWWNLRPCCKYLRGKTTIFSPLSVSIGAYSGADLRKSIHLSKHKLSLKIWLFRSKSNSIRSMSSYKVKWSIFWRRRFFWTLREIFGWKFELKSRYRPEPLYFFLISKAKMSHLYISCPIHIFLFFQMPCPKISYPFLVQFLKSRYFLSRDISNFIWHTALFHIQRWRT